MPMFIPLIVAAVATAAGAVVSALAWAGAVLAAVGGVTGKEELSMVGAVLSLGAGFSDGGASAASAAEGAEGVVAAGAAESAGGSLSADAATEMAAGGDYSGIAEVGGSDVVGGADVVGGDVPAPDASQLAGEPPPDQTGIIGDAVNESGLTDTNQTALKIDEPSIPEIEAPTPENPDGIISNTMKENLANETTAQKPYAGDQQAADAWKQMEAKSGGTGTGDFWDGLYDKWNKMSGQGQGALINVVGGAVAKGFGEDPASEMAKIKKLEYELELEKYRRKMANINNLGGVSLRMQAPK